MGNIKKCVGFLIVVNKNTRGAEDLNLLGVFTWSFVVNVSVIGIFRIRTNHFESVLFLFPFGFARWCVAC